MEMIVYDTKCHVIAVTFLHWFSIYWTLFCIQLQVIAKSASNLVLDAKVEDALPTVQMGLFVGNVRMTSRE